MKRFPIMHPGEYQRGSQLGCPRSIPWAIIEPQDAQARTNHGQSLERLADRGGLSPCEANAVIEGRRWRKMPDEEAVATLKRHIEEYEAKEVVRLRAILRAVYGRVVVSPQDGAGGVAAFTTKQLDEVRAVLEGER